MLRRSSLSGPGLLIRTHVRVKICIRPCAQPLNVLCNAHCLDGFGKLFLGQSLTGLAFTRSRCSRSDSAQPIEIRTVCHGVCSNRCIWVYARYCRQKTRRDATHMTGRPKCEDWQVDLHTSCHGCNSAVHHREASIRCFPRYSCSSS